eukprot:2036523-Prorocentrum_lima.AAC.1
MKRPRDEAAQHSPAQADSRSPSPVASSGGFPQVSDISEISDVFDNSENSENFENSYKSDSSAEDGFPTTLPLDVTFPTTHSK